MNLKFTISSSGLGVTRYALSSTLNRKQQSRKNYWKSPDLIGHLNDDKCWPGNEFNVL